jgi:hypothetical protein
VSTTRITIVGLVLGSLACDAPPEHARPRDGGGTGLDAADPGDASGTDARPTDDSGPRDARTGDDAAPASCAGIDCDGHGRCDASSGAARCVCDAGYHAEGLACIVDGCSATTDPPPVSLAALDGEAPGTSEAVVEGAFHDEYLYDATGYTKVGVRREWGGTITFFGLASGGAGRNRTNTIDANDTGREVQVAFYDPDRHMQNCAWDAACRRRGSTCPGGITYLGWDPVQGGNRCNRGSGVDSLTNAGGVLSLATTPLFWNPNWDAMDCTSSGCDDASLRTRRSDVEVTQSLRFVRTHVVELTYAVRNLAAIDHASTVQEMPTVYSANGNGGTADLYRLFDSARREVVIDTPAGGDGFNYEDFDSAGGWVSLQNADATYGVGIYYENQITAFQGWQLRSLPFNNVRARFAFGIPASGTVNARAYLVLGSLDTVAAEAAWLSTNLAPFGWLDEPAAGATVRGAQTVRGWALDNRGVSRVEVLVDGAPVTELGRGGARPDVCAAWPGYAGCDGSGFSGTLDASALAPCPHLLEIRATDADGNARVIARRRVVVSR